MRFTRQPQTLPRIDYGNPLTDGIVDAVIPSNSMSANGVGAVYSTNANVTYPARLQGRAMVVSSASTTDFQTYGSTTGPLVIAGPLTILSFYRLTAIPGGAQRIAGTQISGGTAGYAIAPNGSNFRFLTGNGSARIAVGSAVSTAIKIDVGTEDAAGNMLFYENGVLTVTNAAGSNSASGSGSTQFKVGTTGSSDNSAAAEHFLHVVWNRVLSASEIVSLSANPWQIFQFSARRVFAPSGGVQSLTVTPSGGIVFSGTGTAIRSAIKSVSGGIQLAGTGATTRGVVRAVSGGIQFGGAATVSRGIVRAVSGGIVFAGSAAVSFFSTVQSLVVTPAGGIVLGGAAAVIRTCTRLVSGGITLAGSAGVAFSYVGASVGALISIMRRRRRE